MAMITVDGVSIPCPSVFTWGLQDISASESWSKEKNILAVERQRPRNNRTDSTGF